MYRRFFNMVFTLLSGHFAAQHIADTLVIEKFYDFHHLIAVVIPLKGFQHQRSGQRVKGDKTCPRRFYSQMVPVPPVHFPFKSVLGLATNHSSDSSAE